MPTFSLRAVSHLLGRGRALAIARALVLGAWTFFTILWISVGCLDAFPRSAFLFAAFLVFLAALLAVVQGAQLSLEARPLGGLAALVLALTWWLVLVATFTGALLLAVHLRFVFARLDLQAGLRAVSHLLDALVAQVRAGDTSVWGNGRSGPLWTTWSEEEVYLARVQALAIPPIIGWATSRFAHRLALPVRVVLSIAVTAGVFWAHVTLAHRCPPFMYRRPGEEGFEDVLRQCLFVNVVGAIGLPVALAFCDRVVSAIIERSPGPGPPATDG